MQARYVNIMERAFGGAKKANYVILSANSTEALTKQVNEKLEDGYRIAGAPFVYREFICQALLLVTDR